MIDIVSWSVCIISSSFMLLYYIDNNEWLLSINSIYNEIRNQETDEKLRETSEKLLKIKYNIQKIIAWFSSITLCIIWLIRWEYFILTPYGYLSSLFICIFAVEFIFPLILRKTFICFFICFKYYILYRDLNRRLSRISVRNKKKHLLSVDNHLCYSVLKANEYLGNVFVISVLIWSSNCCYAIYMMLFSQVYSRVTNRT